MLTLSLDLAFGVVIALIAGWLWKRALIGRRKATAKCYECAYDLRGITMEQCPECGFSVIPPGTRPATAAWERVALGLLALMLTVTASTIGAARWELVAAIWARASQGALSQRLVSYAAKGGSIARAARDADTVVKGMVSTTDPLFSPVESVPYASDPTILACVQTSRSAALAQALDSSNLSVDEFAGLLTAVTHAYLKYPFNETNEADEVLCDLLTGTRTNAGSSGYAPASPVPRALTESQRSELVDTFLTLQGDRTRAWNYEWGQALFQAIVNGWMTPEKAQRYLTQSLSAQVFLAPPTEVSSGDVVKYFVECGWRTGVNLPVRVSAVPTDPRWGARVRGGIAEGETRLTSRTPWALHANLFLPEEVGDFDIEFELLAEFGPNIADDYLNGFSQGLSSQQMKEWRRLPVTRVAKKAHLRFRAAESRVARVVMEEGGLSADDLENGTPIDLVYEQTARGVKVTVSPGSAPAGFGLGWNVAFRQGEREFAVGWVFAPRVGWDKVRVTKVIADLDLNRPTDLVLRSNPGLLERPVWTPRIWKGEIVRPVRAFAK